MRNTIAPMILVSLLLLAPAIHCYCAVSFTFTKVDAKTKIEAKIYKAGSTEAVDSITTENDGDMFDLSSEIVTFCDKDLKPLDYWVISEDKGKSTNYSELSQVTTLPDCKFIERDQAFVATLKTKKVKLSVESGVQFM